MTLAYQFPARLREGIIKSRPNRFIMMVEAGGRTVKCHCPATGRIGSLHFKDIPCLISRSDNPGRKTECTVEAISLDQPKHKKKKWVGINQVDANRYVEFFLRNGSLSDMVPGGEAALREQRLGKSRIDFAVGNAYVEVKTLLMDLPCTGHPHCRKVMPKFTSFQRLINHFSELAMSLKKGKRAILLICYLYDAQPFRVPKPEKGTELILRAAKMAAMAGVENWQINLKVDEEGVALARHFPLELF